MDVATGSWPARPLLRLTAAVALVAWVAALLLAFAGRGGPYGTLDGSGRPLGTDFTLLWSAGRMALEGRAPDVYDWALLGAVERATHGTDAIPFFGWHYPPLFLLVTALLATAPYLLSLVLWQAVTLASALIVAWRLIPTRDTLLAALGFPAVFVCLAHGQNGFLTAALFGGGLLLLEKRPLAAGLLFGCLAYKPQFALLLPLALAAGNQLRAILGAAVSAAVLSLLTLILFGPEVWTAFAASAAATRSVLLEDGGTGWYKMQSAFAWIRMLGGSFALASAVQGAVTIAAVAVTTWLWFVRAPLRLRAACLVLGSLLATPYLLDYDLVLLGLAMALIAAHGLEFGFRRWEPGALVFAWLVPVAARALAFFSHVPAGFLAIAALFILAAGRAIREAPDGAGLNRIAASWR